MLISKSTAYLKQRDEAVFGDLYMVRYMTAMQLAKMYFLSEDSRGQKTIPSEAAADRRLYRLARQGWVQNYPSLKSSAGNTYKLWVLSEDAFAREREAFGDGPDSQRPAEPKIGRIDHTVAVNDLYVSCGPMLRLLIGDPDSDGSDTWTWRYETKIPREITIAGEGQKLRPDAEIKIDDTIFFVEYQSRESRLTAERMEEKVDNYARYVTHVLRVDPEKAQLLTVTDQPRIQQATTSRAEKQGLKAIAGDTSYITEYLIAHVQGL